MMKRIFTLVAFTITMIPFIAFGTVTGTSDRTEFTCSGTTGPFAFTFPIVTNGIHVIKVDSSGVETTLSTSAYTVTCTNNNCANGGSVTLITTCASGSTLVLHRYTPVTQTSHFVDGMPTLYKTFENSLDKLTMINQNLANRVPMLKETSPLTGLTLTPEANKYIGWNAAATNLENKDNIITSVGATNVKYLSNYASFAAAITSIGSTNTTLVIDCGANVTNDTTIPATIEIITTLMGSLNISSGKTLTINGPFFAGNYQVFTGTGTVTFGKGALSEISAAVFGLSESASASVNATALQMAINSQAPKIIIPNGTFDYDTQLDFENAIIFQGAGSFEESFYLAGPTSTVLNYTGTDSGIVMHGKVATAKGNMHLSDFILTGSASATGDGISIGDSTSNKYVVHSSLKNIGIRGFTHNSSCGLRARRVLETEINNVVARDNFHGFCSKPGDVSTILLINNLHTYTNTRYGTYLNPTLMLSSSFRNLINESNDYAGLRIDGGVNSTDFYTYYSEDNMRVGGTAPIEIGLDPASSSANLRIINFWGGTITDAGKFPSIALDNVAYATFKEMSLQSFSPGFITVTANTIGASFDSTYYKIGNATAATGYAFNRISINGTIAEYILNGEHADFPIQEGVFSVSRWHTATGATVVGSTTAAATTIVADAGASFTNVSSSANKINIAHNPATGKLGVWNKSGGDYTFVIKQ